MIELDKGFWKEFDESIALVEEQNLGGDDLQEDQRLGMWMEMTLPIDTLISSCQKLHDPQSILASQAISTLKTLTVSYL